MSAVTKLMTPGGGGVSLTPASSIASDVTVNVPSQNCTLGIQGPAFSAYAANAQTISTGTWTKVVINTEEFDTNSNFDSATNYRFTPTVAGYYQISGSASVGGSSNSWAKCSIYKNGSGFKNGTMSNINAFSTGNSVSSLIYFNGSTDYVELYVIHNIGSNGSLDYGQPSCYFQGCLVRAA